MNKLIITRWNSRVLTALVSEKTTIELGLADTSSVLGNIYIGKVKKIVRNLNSAFVDFSDGCTGYYSLTDNKVTLFADGHERKLKEGDEIIVQVAKDAVNQGSGPDREPEFFRQIRCSDCRKTGHRIFFQD